MKPSLSVIIITKNSAAFIEKCLQSVAWADEIVVLDSGSTDQTVSICRKYTDNVFQTDWPGFGPQKNRALEKAKGDWIFSIDSDEWIDEKLKSEILYTIENPTHTVFKLKRLNQYCGQWIRFGDVGKDFVTRLFKKNAAHFSDDIVHEKIITDQKIGQLKSLLFHNSYRSYEELIDRMNRYTSLSAEIRFKRGKNSTFAKAIFGSVWAFLRAYIFRAGFLDGKMGFVVAVSSAESSYYRHLKLISLCNSQKTQN